MRLPSASKLELAEACAASQALPQTPEVYASGADGSALHAFAQAVATGGDVEDARAALPIGQRERADDVARVLPQWLGGATIEAAYAWDTASDSGRYLGAHLGRKYDVTETELPGAADWADSLGLVADLKTGRIPPPPAATNAQLHLLALAMARTHGLDSVQVVLIHVPPFGRPVVDTHVLDFVALEAAAARFRLVAERVTKAHDDVRRKRAPYVTTGAHCRHCRAIESCPRSLALMRATQVELDAVESAAVAQAHDGDVLALRDAGNRLLTLGHRMVGVAEAIGRQRTAEGRPVLTPDGKEWREVVTQRRALDGATTYRVLEEMHGGAVAQAAVKMAVTQTSIKAALQDGVEAARAAWKAADPETRGKQPTAKGSLLEVVERVERAGGVSMVPHTTWAEVSPGAPALPESEEGEP